MNRPSIRPKSRNLKDRLTKVPDWFRPTSPLMEAYAKQTLKGIADRKEMQDKRVEATKASALGRVAEIIRKYDVRGKSFLGGKNFPWTPDSWKSIHINTYKKEHPIRYYVWRCTGLMAPTF